MFQDVWEWFQPHQTSYAKSRILDSIQNSVDLIVFKFQDHKVFTSFYHVWGLSCMRVWDWHLIKQINPIYTLMLVVLIVELFCHNLIKKYSSLIAWSLIKHVKLFLPCFNDWIRKFHQNCTVLSRLLMPLENQLWDLS